MKFDAGGVKMTTGDSSVRVMTREMFLRLDGRTDADDVDGDYWKLHLDQNERTNPFLSTYALDGIDFLTLSGAWCTCVAARLDERFSCDDSAMTSRDTSCHLIGNIFHPGKDGGSVQNSQNIFRRRTYM